jgi:hypothetical protein
MTTLARTALALALSLGLASSLSPGQATAAPGTELSLGFEGTNLSANTGTASLVVAATTAQGGTMRPVAGSAGAGTGVRLPAYHTSRPPLAVFTVTDRTGADVLSPGTGAFSFGADFTLDARSQGSATDNGNNLIQRGLYTASAQYKLQVDQGRPLCRVKGRSGAVIVQSTRTVQAGAWHQVRCSRVGSTVTLTLVRLGDGTTWSWSATGATGDVRVGSAVPLSVGGKVDDQGRIVVASADQFNGVVDNAFYDRA